MGIKINALDLSIVERLGSSDVAKVHQLFYSAKLLWMFLQQGLSSSVYAGPANFRNNLI